MTEADYLSTYDPRAFPPVAVTVDVALFTVRDDQLCVLLIERGQHPYRGAWALPGGFVRPGETIGEAAARELAEETSLERFGGHLEQLATYGGPERDPRMRVVSVAHVAIAPSLPEPAAGTDASAARYWPVAQLGIDRRTRKLPELAFDHATIVRDAVERVRSKLEYTSLATVFCEAPFTIADLRRIYEAVWGRVLDPGNFQRKVLGTPGFIEPTAELADAGPSGGRRPRLYRAGGAALLHPAMLRSTA